MTKTDPENPEYYRNLFGRGGTKEPIDIIKAALTKEQYEGYLMGTVLKYKLRGGDKGDPEGDRIKAKRFQDMLEELRIENNQIEPF